MDHVCVLPRYRRGKPLYLNEARYRLLHQQWLAHCFDKIGKKWILHRDAL